MLDYDSFLQSKRISAAPVGFDARAIPTSMRDDQKAITRWALKRGKAAIWADCGLGKTFDELVWADNVAQETGRPVLLIAPSAVSRQTVGEAAKFGLSAKLAASAIDIDDAGIFITNYEKLHKFDPSVFGGVVLDESSILKSYDGKTRNQIIEAFADTQYKLACTATPSPNDFMEIGNHAQFLGVMSYSEMLATFFTHDGGDTSKWRLKGHAVNEFWKWVASWAVMLRKPSDLGFSDAGFTLPGLQRYQHTVSVRHQEEASEGAQLYLVMIEARTLQERRNARKVSIADRVAKAAEIVAAEPDKQWVLWCNLNDESRALTAAIPGAVEVTGSDSEEHKEQAAVDFVNGTIRVIVTKPSIWGYGLNLQNCCRSVVVGLSDSFEDDYQLVRRFHRFGQQHDVHIHYVVSELEGAVVRNIQRKQQQFEDMTNGMLEHMRQFNADDVRGLERDIASYQPTQPMRLPLWLGGI